jgi:tetratricopeptide (TPR) repeat protein
VHKNARLFRNLPHIRYQGRLHETVGNSILAAGRPIGELQLTIHHFERHIGEKARHEKSLFYRRLAREKLGERPADPQAHLELALLEMDQFHNPQGAATLLQRACALAPENGALCFFHGVALEKSGQHLAAIARFQAAVERRYCTPLLLEYAADGLYNAGIYVEAARMYREARRVEDTACLESKLGLAEMRCGNYGKGRAFLQSAVRREPMNPDNHDRLVTGLLFLDDVSQAARCAEHKLECVPAAERDYHRAAALWSRAGNDCRALHALTSGLVRYPESGLLHEAVKEIEANPAA